MRSLHIGAMVLLLLGVVGVRSENLGQTHAPPAVSPCIDDAGAGRPSLKRRVPAGEGSSDSKENADRKAVANEKCKELALSEKNSVRVEFEGLRNFSESDLLKLLREQGVGLPAHRLPDSEAAANATKALREFFQTRGYMQATVEILNDYESKSVRVVINEGARSTVSEILFAGNRVFSSRELANRIRDCLLKYRDPPEGYHSDIFDFCTRDVTNFVRSQGYLQAQLGEPKNRVTEQGLVMAIPVKEGPLYRLGEIRIEGANAVAPEEARNFLSLQRGDAANGEKIGKWLFEDLKKVYGRLGYIQYTAEPEPDFKAPSDPGNEGIVDFKVTIEEGKQFTTGPIKFAGNNLPEQELRNLFLLREGDVYDQEAFERSIERLNELRLFEFIDKDKDVDFKVDEELAVLTLVVKLVTRARE
jgi:outer membrane protein insertion porin family